MSGIGGRSRDRLFTGTNDGIIIVWDVFTGKKLASKKAHKGAISKMVILPPDRLITTSDEIKSSSVLKVWDIHTLKLRKSLRGFMGRIKALTPIEGNRFASTDQKSQLTIWNSQTYRRVRLLRLDKSGTCLLCYPREKILICGRTDGIIEVWNYNSSKRKKLLQGHNKYVKALIRIDRHKFVSGSDDCSIRIWKRDGRNYPCLKVLKKHKASILCLVKFGRNHFLSGSSDGTIRLWDTRTGTELQTYDKKVMRNHYQSFSEILGSLSYADRLEEEKKKKEEKKKQAEILGEDDGAPQEEERMTVEQLQMPGGDGENFGVDTRKLPSWESYRTKDLYTKEKGYEFKTTKKEVRLRRSIFGLVAITRTIFAAWYDDGRIRIYNAQTKKCQRTITHKRPFRAMTSLSDHLSTHLFVQHDPGQMKISLQQTSHGGGIILKRPKELGRKRQLADNFYDPENPKSKKKKLPTSSSYLNRSDHRNKIDPYDRRETLGMEQREEFVGVELPKERLLYVRYIQYLSLQSDGDDEDDEEGEETRKSRMSRDDHDDRKLLQNDNQSEGEEEEDFEEKKDDEDDEDNLNFQIRVNFKEQTIILPKSLARNFIHLPPPSKKNKDNNLLGLGLRKIHSRSRSLSLIAKRRSRRISSYGNFEEELLGSGGGGVEDQFLYHDEEDVDVSSVGKYLKEEDEDMGFEHDDNETDTIVYDFPDVDTNLDDELLYEVLSGGDVHFDQYSNPNYRNVLMKKNISIEQYFELFQFFSRMRMVQHMYVLCRKVERIRKMKDLMVLFVKAIRTFEHFPFLLSSTTFGNEKEVVNSFMRNPNEMRRRRQRSAQMISGGGTSSSSINFRENCVTEKEFGSAFTLTLFNVFRSRLSEIDRNPKYIRFFTTMGCFDKLEDFDIIPIEYHRDFASLKRQDSFGGFNNNNNEEEEEEEEEEESFTDYHNKQHKKKKRREKKKKVSEEEVVIEEDEDEREPQIVIDEVSDSDDDEGEKKKKKKKKKKLKKKKANFYRTFPTTPSFRYLFQQNLSLLYKSGVYANMMIRSKPVHREILMIRSQFFYNLFRKQSSDDDDDEDNNNNNNNKIFFEEFEEIEKMDPNVLDGMIDWIYQFHISDYLIENYRSIIIKNKKKIDSGKKKRDDDDDEEEEEEEMEGEEGEEEKEGELSVQELDGVNSYWLKHLLSLFSLSVINDELELNFLVRRRLMDVLVRYYREGKIEVKFLEHGFLLDEIPLLKKKEFVSQLSSDFGIPRKVLRNLIDYSVKVRGIIQNVMVKKNERIRELEMKVKRLEGNEEEEDIEFVRVPDSDD